MDPISQGRANTLVLYDKGGSNTNFRLVLGNKGMDHPSLATWWVWQLGLRDTS